MFLGAAVIDVTEPILGVGAEVDVDVEFLKTSSEKSRSALML